MQQTWKSAHASRNEKLLQACYAFVVGNLDQLSESNFVAKLEECDFTRVLTMAISEGMDAETILKTVIFWIKSSSPHRNAAFERLITKIDCSELSSAFVTSLFAEEFELFSNAANRFVRGNLQISNSFSYNRHKALNCKMCPGYTFGIGSEYLSTFEPSLMPVCA